VAVEHVDGAAEGAVVRRVVGDAEASVVRGDDLHLPNPWESSAALRLT
jgi:hypothetical protein